MLPLNDIPFKTLKWFDQQTTSSKFLLTAALLSATCYLDAATGTEISVSFLYILPVILAAFALGWKWGLLFGLLAAAAERFVFATHPHEFASAIRIWNTLIRLCSFGVVVWLVLQLKRAMAAEKNAARRDFLTGLLNRRAFEEHAQNELERCRRRGTPISILYVDCDDFKLVNDKGGHRAGDKVLQSVAETIKSNLRSTDILARLGGDEFAALLPESGESQARSVAAKLHKGLNTALASNGAGISCSLGVAVFAAAPDDVETMIHRADELMYRVKQNGKGAAQIDVFFGH